MRHVYFKPCQCRVCIGAVGSSENPKNFYCKIADVDTATIQLVRSWQVYDLKEPSQRHVLAHLPQEYTDLTNIYIDLNVEKSLKEKQDQEMRKLIPTIKSK